MRRNKRKNNKRNGSTQKRVNKPVATTSIIRNRGVAKTVRIRHKEFIKDLDAPEGAGLYSKIEVNPGIESTFPWLSAVAMRFETYKWNSLRFHYVPSVATTTAGSLLLAPDYDAADDNSSASKGELLQFEDAVRGPWWSGFTMECSKHNLSKAKELYVRGQDLVSNLDIKTYDVLQLNIMRAATSAVSGAGELWVEYDITLITPQKKHYQTENGSRRFEGIFNIVGGAATTIVNVLETAMSQMDVTVANTGLKTDEFFIGIHEPGVYMYSIATDVTGFPHDAATTIPSEIDWSAAYRDGSLAYYNQNASSLKDNWNQEGIFIVGEESTTPGSTFNIWPFTDGTTDLIFPNTDEQTFSVTVAEVLAASPYRASFTEWVKSGKKVTYSEWRKRKVPKPLPRLNENYFDFSKQNQEVCYCCECLQIKVPLHGEWAKMKDIPCIRNTTNSNPKKDSKRGNLSKSKGTICDLEPLKSSGCSGN